MTPSEILTWFLVILAADIVTVTIEHLIRTWWKKATENVKCDICGLVRKTRKTFDKKLWACTKCRKIYKYENRPVKEVKESAQ